MGKTLSRDIQVLLKILAYIEKMQNVLKKYHCKYHFRHSVLLVQEI